MPLLKDAIAYVRDLPDLTADDQVDAAREAGCRHVYHHAEFGKSRDMRAEWIKGLGTKREVVAWVARLDVLIRRRAELPDGVTPSRDAAKALALAIGKAKEIVEGETGATSSRTETWETRVDWMLARASRGIPKNRAKQVEYGRKGGAIIAARSIRRKWKSRRYTKQRQDAARIWRDPIYTTWMEARAALPEELQGLSYPTLWRLFGGRDPHAVNKGRPPKPSAS